MDYHDNEDDSRFPPEYAHLEQVVREAQEQIEQIEEQIKNVPKDQGPQLRHDPPGFLRSRQPGSRDATINGLKQQKEQIKNDLMKKVEKETQKADPKTARDVQDKVVNRFYPNPYKKMDAAEKAKNNGERKDVNQSQMFMQSLRSTKSAPSPTDKSVTVTQQVNVQQEKKEEKQFSMSARFNMTLSYTKVTEKADKAPDKTEKTPGKTDPAPGKPSGKDDLDKD